MPHVNSGSRGFKANSGVSSKSGPDEAFIAIILCRIRKSTFFPDAARKRKGCGLVIVRFSVDGFGRACEVAVQKSSGVRCLDQAARTIIRRASPFGRPPANFSSRHPVLSVPLNFRMVKR
ncbi:MAG: hypothetical protein CVV64_15620 [Candidatus Wallbacteria bacterium HGW-Wallbacteria-1]|uniref:TonB C-terminal domain-containing protein n=1 Tax=Candidatus Wallbacteria bacterium HGW-Wallbacteria-1 TaxID=2013854 RepID=A0A2N1PLC3_9BACT|nr:MAG: hypothetical protein CVV64_15620 [Candidatus Wallbacteria bacterium HGW-Wallbacteria-1]